MKPIPRSATASHAFSNLVTPAGPLTITITVLCVLVFLWMQISGTDTVMDYLAWPQPDQQGELWRWISRCSCISA